MADDLSSAAIAPRGVDLIAGRAGDYTRGVSIASTAVLAAGTAVTAGIELGSGTLRLDQTATAGTGNVVTTIQTSFDNGVTDPWRPVGAFPAQTGATVRQVFPGLDRWVRASLVVTTGPITVALAGEGI